jgi:hypothetical protein
MNTPVPNSSLKLSNVTPGWYPAGWPSGRSRAYYPGPTQGGWGSYYEEAVRVVAEWRVKPSSLNTLAVIQWCYTIPAAHAQTVGKCVAEKASDRGLLDCLTDLGVKVHHARSDCACQIVWAWVKANKPQTRSGLWNHFFMASSLVWQDCLIE